MKNTNIWIRRIAAGAVLAAAPALIALGAAANSQAAATPPAPTMPDQTAAQTSPSTVPWYQSSYHDRHAAQIQSFYQ